MYAEVTEGWTMSEFDRQAAEHWRKQALSNEETIHHHETGWIVFLGASGAAFIERLKAKTKELWRIVAGYEKRD
jgi:hypothetical protein